jgi:hypothetical protein
MLVMSTSHCHWMLATSCQKLPLQFSFDNLGCPITDKHPWPNTNPSHKLQKDYRKVLLLRMTDHDAMDVRTIFSVNEDAVNYGIGTLDQI